MNVIVEVGSTLKQEQAFIILDTASSLPLFVFVGLAGDDVVSTSIEVKMSLACAFFAARLTPRGNSSGDAVTAVSVAVTTILVVELTVEVELLETILVLPLAVSNFPPEERCLT